MCAAQLLHKLGLLTSLARVPSSNSNAEEQLIEFVLLSCYTNLVCSCRPLAPTHYPLCMNELLPYGAHIHSVGPKLRCCYCCTYFLVHAAAAYACCTSFSASIIPTSVGHEYFSPRLDFFLEFSGGVAHLSSPSKTPMTLPWFILEIMV